MSVAKETPALRAKATEQALVAFRAKAPVCLCTPRPCHEQADMCGPQKKAMTAKTYLVFVGFEFPEGVWTALSHAHTGEGRGEFDALMVDWVAATG